MASCTRNARFELRRNSSSNWTTINPKLLAGEPGVELDTGQMKVGDGIRNWNSLPYVGTTTAGPTGPTGEHGEFITTLIVTVPPAAMLTPTSFVLSGTGGKVQSEEAYVSTVNGIFLSIREPPNIPNTGDKIRIGLFSVSVPGNCYIEFRNSGGSQEAEFFINNVTTGYILTVYGYEMTIYLDGTNVFLSKDGVPIYINSFPGNSAQSFGFFAEAVTLTSPVTYSVVKFFPTGLAGVQGITGPTGVRGSAFYYGTDIDNPQGPIPNPSVGDLFLNTETGQLYVKLT